jgi:transposase
MLRASEQDRADIQEERAVFCERVRQLDRKDLVFVNETGITTAMTLSVPARPPLAAAGRPGRTLGGGMMATMSIKAATTTRVFSAFLRAVLSPELRRRPPNATMLMDNLPANKARAVETTLAEAGLKFLYLPRYASDLSPLEPGWSKAKGALRAAVARPPEALEVILAPALDSITPADARGRSNQCSYAPLY